jgi:transitional endoplasmic reticulum ATPase
MRSEQSTAVIVPYADALLPAGDPSFMAQQDRQTYLVFHRWSLDKTLTSGDNITILITESLGAINPGLLSNPKVAAIEIPMPDLDPRRRVIAFLHPSSRRSRSRCSPSAPGACAPCSWPAFWPAQTARA